MKRIVLPFVSLLAALALPSCLQQATTIHLNKDGSGTIVEETTFGAQMSAMLGGLGGLGGDEAKDPLKDLVSPDKAKARAAKLGEGVTVEKTEAIDANGSKGARVTYRFADINKLKFTTSGGLQDAMPAMPNAAVPVPDKPVEPPTTFKYADGTLTIITPAKEPAAAPATDKQPEGDLPPELGDLQGEQMEAMMKQMLGDMKVSLKVVIEPGIAESTATHVTGNTITLMEMDMGKVMKNPEAFKQLKGVDQSNPEKAMEALKGFDGIKVEPKKEVTVKVK
jgi:hypothetical protein